jgi:hypothetical protein
METDQRIKDAIPRLGAAGPNGSFGLWSVNDIHGRRLRHGLPDASARARFDVPATAYMLAIDRLRNYVATAPEANKWRARTGLCSMCWSATAPRPWAICGILPMSGFGCRDTDCESAGRRSVSDGWLRSADNVYLAALNAISLQPKLDLGRADFGSALRDAAALVTLASEGKAPQKTIDDAVLRIDTARSLSASTSTQEDAWLVLAARALTKQLNAISLAVNGDPRQG